ncbi:MAG: hypothetical protein HQL50_02705 [Magnetococcales bacterium]|nr:hypothetical protein [Magnetococcales bacterium]
MQTRRTVLIGWIVTFLSLMGASQASSAPPVVIMADGFGDCCTHRMTTLIDGLKSMGAVFPAIQKRGLSGGSYGDHVNPWNSLTGTDQGFGVNMDLSSYLSANPESLMGAASSFMNGGGNNTASLLQQNKEKIMQAVRKGSDDQFMTEVSSYVDSLPKDQPVILIGHSFGADSVTKVAKRISRPILFLGALDPVGAGGMRRMTKDREIPGNVIYFYNRWQENEVFPFDFGKSGAFGHCRAKTCDQKEQSVAKKSSGTRSGSSLGHIPFPSDPFIQQEILTIIKQLLSTGSAKSGSSSSDSNNSLSPKSVMENLPASLPKLF